MLMTVRQYMTVKDKFAQWLDDIAETKKVSITQISRMSRLAPSTLLRIVNDEQHKFTPTMATIQKVKNGTGVPVPKGLLDAMQQAPAKAAPPRASTNSKLVTVQPFSALPASIRPKPTEVVRVPMLPQLEADPTAFAFYAPDDSLKPFVPQGTLVYATKRRDPREGDMVLLVRKGRATMRTVASITEQGIGAQNSYGVETVKFDDIEDIAIVVATVFN